MRRLQAPVSAALSALVLAMTLGAQAAAREVPFGAPLRISTSPYVPEQVTLDGLVERVRSGEKQRFDSVAARAEVIALNVGQRRGARKSARCEARRVSIIDLVCPAPATLVYKRHDNL